MKKIVTFTRDGSRSEAFPPKPCEIGRLYLWFPEKHSLSKVSDYLKKTKINYELMTHKPGLSVICTDKQLDQLLQNLKSLLTIKELETTRTLLVQGVVPPQIQDFGEITSLQRLIRFNQSHWLLDVLSANRLTSHFQPIVYIDNPVRVYGYEALLRGVDEQGNWILPERIFDLAREAGLLAQVDLAARCSAIRAASHHNITQRIFINFSPTAIYDPVTCLRTTVQAIDEAGIPHENIVFEVIESDPLNDRKHLEAILCYYRECGFTVALDDFGAGYSSLNLLHQLRPDLIKLDQDLIRNVHCDPYKALVTEKLLETTQKLNIKTVAEGIECEEELCWLRQHGATFAQGFFIAKPHEFPRTFTDRCDAPSMLSA